MAFQTEVFEGQFKITEEGVAELTAALNKLISVADKVTSKLSTVKITIPKVDTTSIAQAGKVAEEAGKKVKSAFKLTSLAQFKADSAETAASVAGLTRQFDEVRRAGGAVGTTLSERLRGVSLAATGTGSRLQGLREIIAGTTSSTNGFVNALDFIIKRNDPLARLSSNLQKSIAGIAETASSGTRALASQGDILKRVVAAEFKGSTAAADEFNKQVTRVNSSFKQIFVTASKGGDISQGLLRARIEVKGLEDEYQLLSSRGIIKAGSESDKLFQKMITDARTTESRLQALNQRYQGTQKSIAAAKIEQDRMTASGQKQVTIFGAISIKLSNLFNIFRGGKTDITNSTQQLDRFGNKLKDVETKASGLGNIFKSVFGGVFIGNLASNAVLALTQKFTGAIQAASNAQEEMSKFFVVFQDEGDRTGHVLADSVIGQLDAMAEAL